MTLAALTTKHGATTHSRESISEALSYIPADDRATWIRMGMAIKSELGAGAFNIWDQWSQAASNYDAKDAKVQWRSFKESGAISIGTLFFEAQQRGFKANGHGGQIDAAELERLRQGRATRLEAEAREARAKAAEAEKRAAEIFNGAADADDSHPYLIAKGIQAHGAKLYRGTLTIGAVPCDGALLIPIKSGAELRSLQFITPDGEKLFLPHGRVKGGYFGIGAPPKPGERICVAEGFATGATVNEASGLPVVCAFNAGNLFDVATLLRRKYPEVRIVLCADDDVDTKGNPGLAKATEAARAVDGLLAVPDFGANRKPMSTDFNDLRQHLGAEAVKAALEHAAGPAAHASADHDERNPPPEGEAAPRVYDWPAAIDLESLAEREPERPKFIINDWLPVGYATLLAGHGGVGKSGIALNLSVCIAAGIPFFGLETQRRRVLYLSCEDRESVLHWRLTRICTHVGIQLAALRGWLEIVDLVGHDVVLWERNQQTGNTLTPAFGRLEERMEEYQSELLVVDGISDTFAGNENARTEVKRYVNGLVSLIPEDSGAVLLVGHIAKPSAANSSTSEGYSGSTGWHNSARARWYLYPETTQAEDGERERTGTLTLELQKSNLGRTDQEMKFSWDDSAHMFTGRRTEAASQIERSIKDRVEREGILAALRACATATPQVDVPAATTGRRTAFHVLSIRPEFPDSLKPGRKAEMKRFWRQIEELRAMGNIRDASITRADRHKVQVLELAQRA